MEFHLPYYALRRGFMTNADPRGLRRCGKFEPIGTNTGDPEYLYEAQTSVMVTGFDEWFWTTYCCVETYFENKESIQFYHDTNMDAPTGAARPTNLPVWNPRQYYLLILSRRMGQMTKEWANIVNTFDKRLQYYVRMFIVVGRPSADWC